MRVQSPQELLVRKRQASRCDRIGPTLQSIAVYELVRQQHDLRVHAILVREVYHGFRLRIGQSSEERHVQAALARRGVPYLEM